MITRHFLKALVIFTGMIVLGLFGVFLVSYLDKGETKSPASTTNASDKVPPIAK